MMKRTTTWMLSACAIFLIACGGEYGPVQNEQVGVNKAKVIIGQEDWFGLKYDIPNTYPVPEDSVNRSVAFASL